MEINLKNNKTIFLKMHCGEKFQEQIDGAQRCECDQESTFYMCYFSNVHNIWERLIFLMGLNVH